MTPDEVESCILDFARSHKVTPTVIIAGEISYAALLRDPEMMRYTADGAFFHDVPVISDPLIKGIVISS